MAVDSADSCPGMSPKRCRRPTSERSKNSPQCLARHSAQRAMKSPGDRRSEREQGSKDGVTWSRSENDLSIRFNPAVGQKKSVDDARSRQFFFAITWSHFVRTSYSANSCCPAKRARALGVVAICSNL